MKKILYMFAICAGVCTVAFRQDSNGGFATPEQAIPGYSESSSSESNPIAPSSQAAVTETHKTRHDSASHSESYGSPTRHIVSRVKVSDSVFHQPRFAEGGNQLQLQKMKAGVWADELIGDRRALRQYDEFGGPSYGGFYAYTVDLDPEQYVLVDMKTRQALYDAGPCKNRLAPMQPMQEARRAQYAATCEQRSFQPSPVYRGCVTQRPPCQQGRRDIVRYCDGRQFGRPHYILLPREEAVRRGGHLIVRAGTRSGGVVNNNFNRNVNYNANANTNANSNGARANAWSGGQHGGQRIDNGAQFRNAASRMLQNMPRLARGGH